MTNGPSAQAKCASCLTPRSKLPQEADDFLAAHPDTTGFDAFFADLSGVERGKRYPMNLFGKILTEGAAMPGTVFLLDTIGESHDPEGMGFSDGDPDHLIKPIPGTLKPVPWARQPLAQVMMSFENADGSALYLRPAQRAGQGDRALLANWN